MRILHITTFLQGGAGRIIAALAVAQRHAGHDVTLVTDSGGEPGYGSYPEYLEQLADTGIAVRALASTFKRDLALNVAAADALWALVREAPPDVVHSHAAIPTLVAALARRRQTWPVVQTMHGWGVHKTPDQARTDIALLAVADARVTPSRAARDTLTALGLTAAVDVIPYGITPQPVAPAIDARDETLFAGLRTERQAIAICIGTLGERKQQTLLVDALVRSRDVTAVFIGEGDVETLRAHAVSRGVERRVQVLGYRREASRYLAHADALVLPSKNEGLPIVVLEALRAGVAVVGAAIPEIGEALDAETGWLFNAGDAEALAAALRTALESAARPARQAAARALFAARYELPRMTEAYAALYRAQVAGTRPAAG